jgi:hypothetical protein
MEDDLQGPTCGGDRKAPERWCECDLQLRRVGLRLQPPPDSPVFLWWRCEARRDLDDDSAQAAIVYDSAPMRRDAVT